MPEKTQTPRVEDAPSPDALGSGFPQVPASHPRFSVQDLAEPTRRLIESEFSEDFDLLGFPRLDPCCEESGRGGKDEGASIRFRKVGFRVGAAQPEALKN